MSQDKAHPTPPAVQSEREAFEAFWLETRGARKCRRELSRHPLQPATYVSDSANRHWVTWQAGVAHALAAPVASNTTAEPAPIQPAGVEVLKDIRWRLDDIRDMLMQENGRGDRIYGCDEWSTPVVNLQTAIRVIDKALDAASQGDRGKT